MIDWKDMFSFLLDKRKICWYKKVFIVKDLIFYPSVLLSLARAAGPFTQKFFIPGRPLKQI
jgi:hypothetical protein